MYNFYYDESEHSRSIGYNTITADNFYDNFITIIVGWKANDEEKIQNKYLEFEEKYIARHPKGELKSGTIKNSQLRCGFASLADDNIRFISDYYDLFSDEVYVYITTFSKVEYIINQLFKDYENSLFFDMDKMRYSIIKSLVIYKPHEVVDAIYNNPENIVPAMKTFFIDRIEKNKNNLSLKEKETESFKEILLLLNDVNPIDCINWDYTPPFVGFHHFLDENSISDYSLTIDREGEHKKTVLAARAAGLNNVDDEVSEKHFAIRMADMLAGILGKLMKSLCKAIHPADIEVVQKTILSDEWFNLSDAQLDLYKKLHHIFCELNNSWYKSFAGTYADDLVCINTLLNFMNHFNNVEEIQKDLKMQGEYFNFCACEALSRDFAKKGIKLPIEPIPKENIKTDFYLNQRGAKVYYDTQKQPELFIPDGNVKYRVLSVGFDRNKIPLVTIQEKKDIICCRLPEQLLSWAITAVSLSNLGENMFPSDVVFTKKNEEYYADIL